MRGGGIFIVYSKKWTFYFGEIGTFELGADSSDYIANILEARHRISPQPGPLHLSRKSDYLDIEIQAPDMDAYDIN